VRERGACRELLGGEVLGTLAARARRRDRALAQPDPSVSNGVGWLQTVPFVLVWAIGLNVAARFFAAIDGK
jgi:hypothetical protein